MQKVFVSENGIECDNERSFFLSEKNINVLRDPYFMKNIPLTIDDEYVDEREQVFV